MYLVLGCVQKSTHALNRYPNLNTDIWVIQKLALLSGNLQIRKFMEVKCGDEEGYNSPVQNPVTCILHLLLHAISCVGRGSILLESNNTFFEYFTNSGNQFTFHQVQIHMLSLLSCGSCFGPDHHLFFAQIRSF